MAKLAAPISLDFMGPYNWESIGITLNKNQVGLYIWGFLFDKVSNQKLKISNLLDCNNMNMLENNFLQQDKLFIPYYVGIASGKSDMTIFKRLSDHHKVRLGDSLKKTRIKDGYLKNIITDKPLDRYIRKNMVTMKNYIHYFNNYDFLKTKYGKEPYYYNGYPIDLQIMNKISIKDILFDSTEKRNFFFLYCDISKDFFIKNNIFKHLNDFDLQLEKLESFICYSLKGITISDFNILETVKTEILPDLLSVNLSINNSSSCNDLFKIKSANQFNTALSNPIGSGHPSEFKGDY